MESCAALSLRRPPMAIASEWLSSRSNLPPHMEISSPFFTTRSNLPPRIQRSCPINNSFTLNANMHNNAVIGQLRSSTGSRSHSVSRIWTNRVTEQIRLDPYRNRTRETWHVRLKGDFKDMLYGYKFDCPSSSSDISRIVLDPYAKTVIKIGEFDIMEPEGDNWSSMLSFSGFKFRWGDQPQPQPVELPQRDLVIYKRHVRGFTGNELSKAKDPVGLRNDSSMAKHPGSYLGVIEKLYDKEVGVDDKEWGKLNHRGYSKVNFFLPMIRYSSSGACNHKNAFNLLCSGTHKRGIEEFIPVVFNAGSEGNEKGPILSFTGTDHSVYYMLSPKLITEEWDRGGLYKVGSYPHYCDWYEWNGEYRGVVWGFLSGRDGFAEKLAECICGSSKSIQEGGRKPWNGLYISCAGDGRGFTLADLVMDREKYDMVKREDNRDDKNHNNSWNGYQDGEYESIGLKKLRLRQMRNFILCLMVSHGDPLIVIGDENNANRKDHVEYLPWEQTDSTSSSDVRASGSFFRFLRLMIKFRNERKTLGLDDFVTPERLQWHGLDPGAPDWSWTSRFVAFTQKDSVKGEIYVALNVRDQPVQVKLPTRLGHKWEPLVDTSMHVPLDFLVDGMPERESAIKQYRFSTKSNLYYMSSFSSIIMVLKPIEYV